MHTWLNVFGRVKNIKKNLELVARYEIARVQGYCLVGHQTAQEIKLEVDG